MSLINKILEDEINADVKLINFVQFAESAQFQGDITDLGDALAAAGITFTGFQTNLIPGLIKLYGANILKSANAVYTASAAIAKTIDPSFVPPVPDPPPVEPTT